MKIKYIQIMSSYCLTFKKTIIARWRLATTITQNFSFGLRLKPLSTPRHFFKEVHFSNFNGLRGQSVYFFSQSKVGKIAIVFSLLNLSSVSPYELLKKSLPKIFWWNTLNLTKVKMAAKNYGGGGGGGGYENIISTVIWSCDTSN